MKHWTLRKLLAFGFAGPVVLILLLAAVFFYSLGKINGIVVGIVNDNVPGLTLSNQAGTKALMYRAATLRHTMSEDAAEMKRLEAECEQLAQELVRALDAYDRTIHTAEDRTIFNEVGPRWRAYADFAERARQQSARGEKAAALALVQSDGALAITAFQESLAKLVAYNERSAAASATSIANTTQAARSIAAILSAAATALAIGAAFYITRSITRTLRRVSLALDETSSQVTAAATQVASASQSLAGGASQQAASLEETSASIEELSGMTARNSESAQQTKELSNQTRAAADVCARDMQAMNTAMDEIKSSSSDISKIIKTIDEIAFQTNILALNAAVEAARAGEAGMGFAVVAEEVRSLAQRSAGSAKETAEKIAVAIAKSEHGVRLSGQVAQSLGEIVEKARKVDALVAEIATASHEQSQGIRQVNSTVSEMDKVTQSTAGNAEETAAAAEELSAQAVAMRESVTELRQLVGGSSTAGVRRHGEPAHPPQKHARREPAGQALRRPELSSSGSRSAAADDLNFADIEPPARNGGQNKPSPSHNGNGTSPNHRNGTS